MNYVEIEFYLVLLSNLFLLLFRIIPVVQNTRSEGTEVQKHIKTF